MTKGLWKRAFRDHKLLLAVAALYCLSVLGLALWCKVPPRNLLEIFGYLTVSLLTALVFLTGIYIAAFFRFLWLEKKGPFLKRWMAAVKKIDLAARDYMEGERWAYGFMALAVTTADNFFFIAKSLIPVVNPYRHMNWDPLFAAWDKALHFGHYPHEAIIPFVNALGLPRVLDFMYAIWLVVMFVVVGYNLFLDRHLHRRLRFLWVYVISWIFLGTVCATWLSSVGPLFFRDFYPDFPDLYAMLTNNLDTVGKDTFLFVKKTRVLLLEWTKNDRMFDPNSLSAMPSMHVSISWLLVLYARQINTKIFAAAVVFFIGVFLSTLYYGLHYAIDGYVAIPIVTLLWFGVGKLLDASGIKKNKVLT